MGYTQWLDLKEETCSYCKGRLKKLVHFNNEKENVPIFEEKIVCQNPDCKNETLCEQQEFPPNYS